MHQKEWSASTDGNVKLNTASNEAAKFYDATITQFLGWYDDPALGGLGGSLDAMLKADPEFILGRAFEVQLNLMGSLNAPHLDKTLAHKVTLLNELADKRKTSNSITEQELYHVDIVNLWAKNELKQVGQVLEKIITLYPNDLSALKMAQDTYFALGLSMQMRNSLAGSLNKIPATEPLKGYVHGMFAFALEESNMYDESQAQVLRALELIPHDTWAIHNYAHCLEMQAKTDEGLKWMYDKKADWAKCQTLACHQYWHTALFHINSSQFDEAVGLLDQEVLARCLSSGTSLDLVDAASMIYRMELSDLFNKTTQSSKDCKKRWSGVYDVCKPHMADHLWGFNDAHFLMSFLGTDDLKAAREFIDTLPQAKFMTGNLQESVVKPLLEAMYEFKLKNYAKCADLMEDLRFDIIKIGGSHAQRDVFEQLLLVAALKSDKLSHNKLAERMLRERDTIQGRRTVQTDLLAARA